MVAVDDARVAAGSEPSVPGPAAATFDELLGRAPRTQRVVADIGGRTVYLTFQAIPPHELDALQSANPATDAEIDEWRRSLEAVTDDDVRRLKQAFGPPRYSTKALTPALIAACSLEPKMSPEQVQQLLDSPGWSVAEINALFEVCQDLCTASTVVALGKGSEPTPSSAPGSATP